MILQTPLKIMKTSLFSLKTLTLAAACLSMTFAASAQNNGPAPSPHSVLTQVVGTTEVTIDYSRPSAKGRKVFGGIVPMGAVWRTGANKPTAITFSKDVVVGGKDVPAGSYALFTIPGENEWTIIIYSTTEGWGAFSYDQAKDFARFTAKPTKLGQMAESFAIGIDHLRDDSAIINLDWDHTRVSFPIEVGN